MKSSKKLFGLIMAITTDFSLGIIATHLLFISHGYHLNFSLLPYYIAGGLFALLPDLIDFTRKKSSIDNQHRTYWTHWPLVILLLASFVSLFLPFWGILLPINICLHLIHDTYEGGSWGVAWLAPFSFRRLEFFPSEHPHKILKIWSVNELATKNMQLWDWVKKFYLKRTPDSVGAITWALLALVILVTV